jgi:hypothetical protein
MDIAEIEFRNCVKTDLSLSLFYRRESTAVKLSQLGSNPAYSQKQTGCQKQYCEPNEFSLSPRRFGSLDQEDNSM